LHSGTRNQTQNKRKYVKKIQKHKKQTDTRLRKMYKIPKLKLKATGPSTPMRTARVCAYE